MFIVKGQNNTYTLLQRKIKKEYINFLFKLIFISYEPVYKLSAKRYNRTVEINIRYNFFSYIYIEYGSFFSF